MYYRVALFVAVFAAIAKSEPCPYLNETLTNYEDIECCTYNSKYYLHTLVTDPCLQHLENEDFNDFSCKFECFYKKHGLIFNETEPPEHAKFLKNIDDQGLRNSYRTAQNICQSLEKQKVIEAFNDGELEPKCTNYYTSLEKCVFLNILARCPEDLTNQSDYCTPRIRFINQCVFNTSLA